MPGCLLALLFSLYGECRAPWDVCEGSHIGVRTNTPVWLPPQRGKCRNSGHGVCTFLVTCFCGLDALILVEFISEDLKYIVGGREFFVFSLP